MSATLDKVISFGLVVALVFTALAFGTVEPWSIAIFQCLILLLTILWGVKAALDRQITLLIPALAWPLFGLLALGLAQSISFTAADGRQRSLSLDVEATRLTVVALVCLVLGLLLFANFLCKRERIELVAHFLVFYGLALAVFGMIQHFSWNGKFYWLVEPTYALTAPFGPFVNHSHFAGYVEMLMPIPLAMILLKSLRSETRLLYGFAAITMGVATIVSLSRGGMVSMSAGLLFTVAMSLWSAYQRKERSGERHFKRRSLVFSSVGVGALVFVIVLGGIWWVGADPVIERVARTHLAGDAKPGRDTLYSSRGFIWVDTLKLIAANPVLGTGLGAYATAFQRVSKYDGSYFPVHHAHNDYLQILSDAGLVGGILALWFIVVALRSIARGVKHPDRRLAALALGCGGGMFALLVHSVFDFNLQLPANSLLFLLLAAIVSIIGSPARSKQLFDSGSVLAPKAYR